MRSSSIKGWAKNSSNVIRLLGSLCKSLRVKSLHSFDMSKPTGIWKWEHQKFIRELPSGIHHKKNKMLDRLNVYKNISSFIAIRTKYWHYLIPSHLPRLAYFLLSSQLILQEYWMPMVLDQTSILQKEEKTQFWNRKSNSIVDK